MNKNNRGYLLLELVVALGIIGILLIPLIRYSNMLVRMKRGRRALYKNDIMEFEKVSKLSYLELQNLLELDFVSIREGLELFPVTLREVEDGWVGTGVDVAKGIGVRDKDKGYVRIVIEKPDMGESIESCRE